LRTQPLRSSAPKAQLAAPQVAQLAPPQVAQVLGDDTPVQVPREV